ncbi:hypothetical protein [Candidatus Thiodiazotropha sp. CDECU1]|uniref:hypothetical protein n=1 Tax=Candidatus Thiodiazotropha sp. CDECU1 TaxID=3065865 RepID=UPI00292F45CF|nr:hypothetical protein [Candidatus Thiodiazotropha sp. CDECU1]
MKIYHLLFFILLIPAIANGRDMRVVEYERHEFHGDPEQRSSELSTFVYDIPYFGACGIFPPYHIINVIFGSGGSQGGMSPGATWKPFQIEIDEYDSLVQTIKTLDPKKLGENARYTWVKFEFDSSFDHIKKWEKWLLSVCDKHRDSFHKKQPSA